MLVPHAWLWRGVSTRGPPEKATCSAGTTSCTAKPDCSRVIRQRRAVEARSYEPTAALQLAPSRRETIAPIKGSFNSSGPGSSRDGDDDAGPASSRDKDERQGALASSSEAVLKINIDLLLWRSRTARIRARETLDLDERRQLYKAAENGLRRCLLLDSSDPRAYVVLGKTLLQQKRYDEARVLYQDGCANTGNTNAYIWSAWGWLEAQTGNADRARKLYDAAVVVDNTHACAWHKWGMLEKNQGNYTRARDLWMQGIQRCRRKPQSQNAYLYNALACMAAQLGRVGEARAWFEEGTRTAAGAASVALWQAWGVLEATQGDPTAVRYLFRKALQANQRSRYVHLAWALWEQKQGNPQQCLALLQRGSQLNPTDPALYQAWGLMERRAGRIERARQLFEQGLKADPGYICLWQAYGVMEAECGNLDRARQLFQEGVWADPRSADTVYVFHAWGSLEARAGNHQTARELFKAAVRIDPKNETTWASWIAMESELGFVERADDLRIRRAEQQWEFVVPPNFTTRPPPGLMDTLARFFTARGFGAGAGSGSGGFGAVGGVDGDAGPVAAAALPEGMAGGPARAAGGGGGGGSLAGLLPKDYEQLPRLADIERILKTGDLSALPDFASPDDDVELTLQRPPTPMASPRLRPPAPLPVRATPAPAPAAGAGAGGRPGPPVLSPRATRPASAPPAGRTAPPPPPTSAQLTPPALSPSVPERAEGAAGGVALGSRDPVDSRVTGGASSSGRSSQEDGASAAAAAAAHSVSAGGSSSSR